MKQVTWTYLQMSANLKAAEPSSIVRIGAASLAAAEELRSKSSALTSLAEGIHRPGAWLSPAATVFANAASRQAGDVLTISELMSHLGQALNALGGDLGSAKADAAEAVAKSAQLVHEGDELNERVSAHRAAMPADPAPPPGAEQEAARIAEGQNSASIALWGSEHRAIDAWARAGAAFDFVSNATPAVIKKWANKNYDPAKHAFRGKVTGLSSGTLSQLDLPVGGKIHGPNGKDFRLDVQTAYGKDGTLLVTSQDNPAKRGDYKVVGEAIGVTSIGAKAANWQKIGVLLGATAGASYPEGSTFQSAMLSDLKVSDGGAYLIHGGQEPGASIKEASGEPPRGKGNELLNPPLKGLAAGKTSSVPDGISLVNGFLAGVSMAGHLDDPRAGVYHVIYEENSEGDLRAFMQFYRVTGLPGQPHGVDKEAVYVDKHGQLALTPVTGEDPDLYPQWRPGAS